jgi:DNA primase
MDPAELVQQGGAEAIRATVAQSVPFMRFRVEQVLAAGDYGSAEGRERILDQLRPVFSTIPDGAMRLELLRLVAGRLELREGVTERALAGDARTTSGARPGARPAQARGQQGASGLLSRRERLERAFLAFCIAFPREGAGALADVRPEEHFTGALLRRAAEHLRSTGLDAPLEQLSTTDPELARVMAELVGQADALKAEEGEEVFLEAAGPEAVAHPAGRPHVSAESAAAKVRVQRLQLELALLERQIAARARQGVEVSEVAARRAAVKREFDQAQQHALELAAGARA